jgi:membrane protease YdiL (CAAX protease family)
LTFLYSTPPPPAEPLLGSLVAGFVLLAAGLAALTVRPHRNPLKSPQGTRRALMYVAIYTLCATSFARVIGSALVGRDQSPWLLALGDVIFVTYALFVWVMVLAEGHPLSELGFKRIQPVRLTLTMAMGLGAVALYGLQAYGTLAVNHSRVTPDNLVFALLFSAIGSAVPDEVLFRGYLQGSLDGRASRWARVALPALVFTACRGVRFAPVLGFGTAPWMIYIFGVVLPLGLWWGLMRELAGGALWPCLVSHFLLEFGATLSGTWPTFP